MAIIFKGKNSQLTREHNARAWLAHTTASLQRAKKIPPLKKLTMHERDRKPQSWQRMQAIAKQWTVLLGGEVTGKPN